TLIVKIKQNKQAAFDAGLNKNRYTTRILGFATFLALIAGIGGTAARFMGAKADAELTDITTSREVIVNEPVEVTDDYGLYCGQDTITLNGDSTAGYYLFMYADDDGILPTTTTGISNIASAEDWDGLGIGEWGYYVGTIADRESATTNPMPLGYSIIDSKNTATTAGTIPVTYCAKISRNIEEAEFSTNINYDVFAKKETGIFLTADYDSDADDDNDGLSNRLENRYGMNPFSSDSDMDSLNDGDEFCKEGGPHIRGEDNCDVRTKKYGTDPLLPDTDGDGLYDYSEIALSKNSNYEFDPNIADYNGEVLTYSEPNGETTGVPFTVTGTGNIPLTYIDVVDPTDIDESLVNTSGKAYILNSSGNISDASITVDYRTTSIGEGDDTLGQSFSGINVSDDSVDSDDIYALSIVFEETDQHNGELESDITDITIEEENIDAENQKISLNFTGNPSIILVGNNEGEEEILGAGRISIRKIVDKVFTAIKKVAPVLSKIAEATMKIVSSFLNSVARSKCINSGGTWNEETATCERQTGGGGDDDDSLMVWKVSNKFKVNTTDGDSFRKLRNFGVYYDRVSDKYSYSNGQCYGFALLSRLLYLERINTSKTYDIVTDNPEDNGTGVYQFNLGGKDKDTILNTKLVNYLFKTELSSNSTSLQNAIAEDDDVAGAIWALTKVQYTDNAFIVSEPNTLISDLQAKVKGDSENKDDPVVLAVHNTHAVNLLSIGRLYENNGVTPSNTYRLTVYDNNSIAGTTTDWDITCTKDSCVYSGGSDYDNRQVEYAYLLDDYVFSR
ncbi:hypothetical protein IJI94_01580, partial [Candidatus Saccharibacteria bacterium]|nr:hypothetical protein [Candidatus Saccharibacteria bacterium]